MFHQLDCFTHFTVIAFFSSQLILAINIVSVKKKFRRPLRTMHKEEGQPKQSKHLRCLPVQICRWWITIPLGAE